MTTNNLYLTRINGREVLVEAAHAEWLAQSLIELHSQEKALELRVQKEEVLAGEVTVDNEDGYWPDSDSWMTYYRPYNVKNGILSIPVQGVLVHGLSYAFGTWATGYAYIRRAIARGMEDPEVRGIAFIINSGGGEVAGNFDLVDFAYAARGRKPTMAFVNEHAYSAAYSIASVADKISMARTGGVGSIGVLTAWVGMSGALEKAGIEVKLIFAGDHKVDGNPYEKLPKEVQARTQARLDALYGIFTATVARNLGVDEQVIRDTQALTYGAEDAVRIGLAHEVRAFDEAMAAFSSAPNIQAGDQIVSKYTEEELQAQVNSARAEGKAEGIAEGKKEGLSEGAKAERARIDGIHALDEAKGKPKMVAHLVKTGASVEDAKELLAVAAPEQVESAGGGKNHFEEAMGQNNPDLGAGGEQGQQDEGGDKAGKDLVNDYLSYIGQKQE